MATPGKRVGANSDPLEIRNPTVYKETQALLLRQGELFRAERKKAGMSIEVLAAKCGLHFNTIGRIERGESQATVDQLLQVAEVLGTRPCTLSAIPQDEPIAMTLVQEDPEFALVDMLDVSGSTGPGNVNDQHETLGRFAFRRSWLAKRGVMPKMAKIVRARGQSMADRINDGDLVLVNTAIQQMQSDGIYVVHLDGYDYVKLLRRDFATGGLEIISFNPAYRPQLVPQGRLGEVRILGRAVWHGGEL
jgi:phage repressor protein C with HTH and peptisase S24 domain